MLPTSLKYSLIFAYLLSLSTVSYSQLVWSAPWSITDFDSESESTLRNNSISRKLIMPTFSDRDLCFSDVLIDQKPILSLEIDECEKTDYSDYELIGNCVRVESRQVLLMERDTLCLKACNEDGSCMTITLTIEIRRPLRIPIFEDFAYQGPTPDSIIWLDNDVWINSNMAFQAPSIGVATFDGLDKNGRPYPDGRGRADRLTSSFIDLSSFTEADNVFLSFFIQPKGLGPRPREADSLILEFKNRSGNWRKITDYTGLPDNYPIRLSPEFMFRFIKLTSEYLHRDFQFRFVNFNSNTGMTELWHLDYVRMTHGFLPNGTHTDVSFSSPPTSFLKPYSAMPMSHFQLHPEKYINDRLPINIFNHFSNVAIVEPSRLILKENIQNLTISDNLTLLEVPPVVPQNQRNLQPGFHSFNNPLRTETWLGNFLSIIPLLDSLTVETTYEYEQDQERNLGISTLLRNNRVSSKTHLRHYFAYDDSSPELGLGVRSSPGILSELAVRFHAEKDCYLNSVFFLFPRLDRDVSNQIFNLKVYIGNLKDTADYTDILKRPVYGDKIEPGLNHFTGYAILDEETLEPSTLFIPKGDFYVGIQQVTITDHPIPIGFDRNSPNGTDHIFVKLSGTWQAFSAQANAIPGSVMVRAVVNDEDVVRTNHPNPLEVNWTVFPNPADEILMVGGVEHFPNAKIRIVDLLGKEKYHGLANAPVTLSQFTSGIYVAIVQDPISSVQRSFKIIIKK